MYNTQAHKGRAMAAWWPLSYRRRVPTQALLGNGGKKSQKGEGIKRIHLHKGIKDGRGTFES